MSLQATCARVIVKADDEHSGSKIHVPEKAQKPSDRGTVVSVGPGRRHIDGKIYPLEIKVGDKVLFSRMGAFPTMEDGEKLFIMEEEQILAVIAA